MAYEHDLAEMDTAAHFDGLCPLCLKAEIERLRFALQTIHDTFSKDVEQGYKTRDKTYAIEIAKLGLGLLADGQEVSKPK